MRDWNEENNEIFINNWLKISTLPMRDWNPEGEAYQNLEKEENFHSTYERLKHNGDTIPIAPLLFPLYLWEIETN